MSDYRAAILRQEIAHKEIKKLNGVRLSLIEKCKRPHKQVCLYHAFSETKEDSLMEWGEVGGCGASFDEILNDTDFNYCQACKESYRIKRGPLRQAKKELGIAKRAIRAIGRRLLKERQNETTNYSNR